MILVDTSVLVRALGGVSSPKVILFEKAISQGVPFAICPYVYQETLQGVADEVTYRRVRTYLDSCDCLWLPPTLDTYEQASRLYWNLRRKGVTVRGSIAILIALTAIHHDVPLLHDDRDFDHIAGYTPELRIV